MNSYPSEIVPDSQQESPVPTKVPEGFHELMKNIEIIDHLKSKIDQ